MTRPRTIICDIDGVLLKHRGDITKQHLTKAEVLPGAIEKIKEWDLECCTLVLVTGRRESTRKHTEKQLAEAGILYDHLIMGVASGVRELINDCKPDGAIAAKAVNLKRNAGFVYKKELAPEATEKPWGREVLIEANDRYVLKAIHMNSGQRCSLQKHLFKRETIYVLKGRITLWHNDKHIHLYPSQAITIEPGEVHRMSAEEKESVYLEVSTPELDDIVRLEDDYGRVE